MNSEHERLARTVGEVVDGDFITTLPPRMMVIFAKIALIMRMIHRQLLGRNNYKDLYPERSTLFCLSYIFRESPLRRDLVLAGHILNNIVSHLRTYYTD